MPCWGVRLNTVELENVGDHDLLESALTTEYGSVYRRGQNFDFTAHGYSVTLRGGELTSQMPTAQLQTVAGAIKVAYSRASVLASAKRFGWTVKKEVVSQFARN
jgi:hypothetical protein